MSEDTICQQEQIIAYIDGDLNDCSRVDFEQHLETCDSCRSELTAQRLLLCELDAAMSHAPTISAPNNFAHIIAAHAEADMRGVPVECNLRRCRQYGRRFPGIEQKALH